LKKGRLLLRLFVSSMKPSLSSRGCWTTAFDLSTFYSVLRRRGVKSPRVCRRPIPRVQSRRPILRAGL